MLSAEAARDRGSKDRRPRTASWPGGSGGGDRIVGDAGRVASAGFAAYSMTKFGVNGFTEALRQEVTRKHVRVGVIEPGGVATELGSHNSGDALKGIEEFYANTDVLAPEDIADAVGYMVTRPRHAAISEMWVMSTDQA
jgi:NADP-dependent 3-hydroxy acid dehydrogenase YdfG